MTPEEFKSWFAGFTEALSGPPDEAQWKRICEQVDSIQARPQLGPRNASDAIDEIFRRGPTRDRWVENAPTLGGSPSDTLAQNGAVNDIDEIFRRAREASANTHETSAETFSVYGDDDDEADARPG